MERWFSRNTTILYLKSSSESNEMSCDSSVFVRFVARPLEIFLPEQKQAERGMKSDQTLETHTVKGGREGHKKKETP